MKKNKISSGCCLSRHSCHHLSSGSRRPPLPFDVVGNDKTFTTKGGFASLSGIIGCRSVTFFRTGTIIKINGKTPASFGLKVMSRANGLPSKIRLKHCDEAGEFPYTVALHHNK